MIKFYVSLKFDHIIEADVRGSNKGDLVQGEAKVIFGKHRPPRRFYSHTYHKFDTKDEAIDFLRIQTQIAVNKAKEVLKEREELYARARAILGT